MRFHLLLICAIIGCKFSEASFQVQKPGPCDFVETVNISSGHLDMYGNYHHEGTVYPKGLFAEYHYVIKDYNVMVTAEPHFRGCICKVKPCIRLCCLQKEENGINCVTTETLVVPTSEVDEEIVDLTGKDYGVLVGRPCEKMYVLEPQDYTDDKWFFTVSSLIIKTYVYPQFLQVMILNLLDLSLFLSLHSPLFYDLIVKSSVEFVFNLSQNTSSVLIH